ncbi:MAG: bis-aminopropyl spermidine synthase family protein [Candidatus Bathyarchaeia archaeon]
MYLERVEARILYELASSKKTFWELLDRVDSSLKDFVAALKKLNEEGLIVADESGLALTEKGKSQINLESLNFEGKICPLCGGKRIIPNAKFKDILEEFKRLTQKRPSPTIDFFQGYMLEGDVIARVALMHHYGDLSGKSILLIGDDDLLSIALALTRLPSRITVLDIDRRLGDFLSSVNKEYGFNIEYVQYNVADPLPTELRGNFDVFSSEPLETLSGLRAFILRGVSSLRENGVGYFGLTHYEASLKKWLAIQKLLSRMNCVLTDIIQGFSVYPMDYGTANYEEFAYTLGLKIGKNPGINWYKSALFRFEVLGKARLSQSVDKRLRIRFIDKEEDLTHPALYRETVKRTGC